MDCVKIIAKALSNTERIKVYDIKGKIFKTFMVTIREINTHGGPEKFFEKY